MNYNISEGEAEERNSLYKSNCYYAHTIRQLGHAWLGEKDRYNSSGSGTQAAKGHLKNSALSNGIHLMSKT
jgi:hypothetical protein